ncbi:hypothetical protein PCASD_08134 [Puccinia coronata f. sp. avenae]|uniref:RING-type domain-containing protein n=1 Tax=Puccinia coronata f. sp. avenae TaxID=200324 RepID=A0A2N5VAF1_9BASI|nr:hypothetical protein PCASD_08134 [Puccinia coronata f. sp. avenae]
MSQSRRRSTKQPEGQPYISASKSFVLIPPSGDGSTRGADLTDLFDVGNEEEEIKKLVKLIESEYLNSKLEPQTTDVHLKTAISDSKQEIRNLTHQLESIATLAGDLPEFNNTSTGDQIVKELDQQARDLIESIQLIEIRQTELEDLRELIRRSSSKKKLDAHAHLCKKISEQQLKWDALTLRQKFAQSKYYKAFRERIWESTGDGDVMPPVKSFLPAAPGEEDEEESSGDELEIAGGKQNYKCPLCLGYLKTPVVSQLCQHPFCKGCFDSYLAQNKMGAVPCPNAGCSQTLTAASVTEDTALAARVRQFLRRVELREDSQEYDNDDATQRDSLDPNAGEDSKENVKNRRKQSQSQKKRRVIVDDDE